MRPLACPPAARSRRATWQQLFPPGETRPLDLPPEALRAAARQLAEIVLTAHRRYLEEFQQITARARITFENRAWTQGSLDAERVTEPRRVSKRFPAPNKHRDFQPSPLNAPLFRPASVVNR